MGDNAPIILALDLASSTGWACGIAGGKPVSGTLPLAKSAPHGERGAALLRWLNDFLKLERVTIAIIEKPLAPRVLVKIGATEATARLLYGLPFLAETVLSMRGVADIRYVAVQDIRDHFVGQRTFRDDRDPLTGKKITSRKVGKAAVRRMCEMMGWKAETDDQADALAAWSYGQSLVNPRLAVLTTPLLGRAAA